MSSKLVKALNEKVVVVDDYPKKGVPFYDLTPVMEDGVLLRGIIDNFAEHFRDSGIKKVVGIDARGFILGGALAYELGVGFVPIRKAGKLPRDTVERTTPIEYAENVVLQMHKDSIKQGERVLILDDVLATGGTAWAAINMVKSLGGEIVELAFLMIITELGGREKTNGHEIFYINDEREILRRHRK